jgi:hypothetical protein
MIHYFFLKKIAVYSHTHTKKKKKHSKFVTTE